MTGSIWLGLACVCGFGTIILVVLWLIRLFPKTKAGWFTISEVPEFLLTEDWLKELVTSIPSCQLVRVAGKINPTWKEQMEICATIIQIKWSGKICLHCGTRNEQARFLTCECCWMVFYCSHNCLSADQNLHAQECKKPTLPNTKIRDKNRFLMYTKGPNGLHSQTFV